MKTEIRPLGRVVAECDPFPRHERTVRWFNPEKTEGTAYHKGKPCSDFVITRKGRKVTMIHAGDVVLYA